MLVGAFDWTWCLDLHQSFASLLDIAGTLVTLPQRPGEESDTGGVVLNLYLVACALDQLLSDHLHRGFYDLTRAGDGRALRTASRAQQAARRRTGAWLGAGLRRRQRELAALTVSLAASVVAGEPGPEAGVEQAVSRLRATRWPAALRRARMHVPESFRGADLYPADCETLAARAAGLAGSRESPVLVIGLRAAGQYLAPLCAAALDRLGHQDVELASLRPGVPLEHREVARIRGVATTGGWALVVDGSGRNGVALARAMVTLTDLGLPAARICLAAREIAAPAAGGAGEPGCDGLSPAEREASERWFGAAGRVGLEPGSGRVHELMADEAVERWLNEPEVLERLAAEVATVTGADLYRAGDLAPVAASEAPPAAGERRGRRLAAWKLFQVELRRGGDRWREHVLARGVGVGFFGYHSWLVAACLGDLTPEVLGIRDGVVLARWDPGDGMPEPVQPEELDEVAAYVAARARRLELGARREPGPDSPAECAGARRVARLLGRPMGRAAVLAERRAAGALARALTPARHSIVDGCMGPEEWVRSSRGGLVKVSPDEDGLAAVGGVTDPVYDLADAVIRFRLEPEEERRLLDAYVRLGGEPAGLDGRMAFHKLSAGWSELQAARAPDVDVGTAAGRQAFARELVIRETMLTRAVNGYLARLRLADAGEEPLGQLWALRLEGLLETDRLGFESTSPAGTAALRALRVHGQRVLLATGHSLGELRERCATFGLAGGVAEHGAVVWDAGRAEAVPVTGPETRRSLARLREAVQRESDMLADPRHQHSLRLFRHGDGGRRGVDPAEVRTLMVRHGIGGLRVVEGRGGTAVQPVDGDEVAALRFLRSRLPGDGTRAPLNVVVGAGDDLASPGPAEPGEASSELSLRVVTRPGPAGLLRVVRRTVHGWGRPCRRCAPPPLTGADAALMRLCGLQDRGTWARLAFVIASASLGGCEL